jgi:hypothetical protein
MFVMFFRMMRRATSQAVTEPRLVARQSWSGPLNANEFRATGR